VARSKRKHGFGRYEAALWPQIMQTLAPRNGQAPINRWSLPGINPARTKSAPFLLIFLTKIGFVP
jgi:hypothetical protein